MNPVGQNSDQSFSSQQQHPSCPGWAVSKYLHQPCITCHTLTDHCPADYLQHFPPVVLLCNDSASWVATFACFVLHNAIVTCDLNHSERPLSIARHDLAEGVNWVPCSPHNVIHHFYSISRVLCGLLHHPICVSDCRLWSSLLLRAGGS